MNLVRRELIRRLDLSGPDAVPESYGSGVVVDAGGLILTHFHVVQNATKLFVRLPGKKGSYADIYAADGRSDLAVLKLIDPPGNLKPIRFGKKDRSASKRRFRSSASPFPFTTGVHEASPTATHGIVGNLVRETPGKLLPDRSRVLYQLEYLLHTDLRLNLGCSGAAVLNLEGELIGLTTTNAAIIGEKSRWIFAVPMDAATKRIVEVLKKGEEVEYGLSPGSRKLSASRALQPGQFQGVRIDHVAEGTPARKKPGSGHNEVITAVNNACQVCTNEWYQDLFFSIGTALAGSDVVIDVVGNTFPSRIRKVSVGQAVEVPFSQGER